MGVESETVHKLVDDVHRATVLNYDSLVVEGDAESFIASDDDGPEDTLLDRERKAYLMDAVEALPERLRRRGDRLLLRRAVDAGPRRRARRERVAISQLRAEALLLLRDGVNSQLEPRRFPTSRVRTVGSRAARRLLRRNRRRVITARPRVGTAPRADTGRDCTLTTADGRVAKCSASGRVRRPRVQLEALRGGSALRRPGTWASTSRRRRADAHQSEHHGVQRLPQPDRHQRRCWARASRSSRRATASTGLPTTRRVWSSARACASQVSGLRQATRNAQDGVSVVQTAEGALTEVHSMLGRMRDLIVQAANTASSDSAARQAAQNEIVAAPFGDRPHRPDDDVRHAGAAERLVRFAGGEGDVDDGGRHRPVRWSTTASFSFQLVTRLRR